MFAAGGLIAVAPLRMRSPLAGIGRQGPVTRWARSPSSMKIPTMALQSQPVVWPDKSATAKLIYPFKGWQ
jgi:hypothetical protein